VDLVRKLEIELDTVLAQIEVVKREHKMLMEWRKDLQDKLAREIRRKELPETRDKKVGRDGSSSV